MHSGTRNRGCEGQHDQGRVPGLVLRECDLRELHDHLGTQPLCYCKGLKLVNCRMIDTDLAFEKSEVEAEITTSVISIKNPKCGTIHAAGIGEIIMDDPEAEGQVIAEE